MNAEIALKNSRYAGYCKKAGYYDTLKSGMEYEFHEIVDSIPCEKNIKAVADYVREKGFDTVVGIGGGRGLDFARAITHFVPVKVILVPTLAATNAPISTLSVIYSDDGSKILDYWRMDNAPDLTLVDTGISFWIIRNVRWRRGLPISLAHITRVCAIWNCRKARKNFLNSHIGGWNLRLIL